MGYSIPSSLHAEYIPIAREGKAHSSSPSVKSILTRFLPTTLILALGILIGTHYPSFLSIYSRRPQRLPSYLPVTLPLLPSEPIAPYVSLPPPPDPVPNIVHYVYGLDTGPQPNFPYFAYLAMRSALVTLKPERVMFHCAREPQGYWWDRVMEWEGWVDVAGETKGLVEVVPARQVTHVGSLKRPVHHFAHKADIVRLEVLQKYGGVYVDIDTFVLRPFEPMSLYQYDTVLGMEARVLNFLRGPHSDDEMDPKGLCNAIIVSRPNATFVQRWLASYEGFDESHWTEHSVELPWTLAKLYPTTVTVLSERAFFWPLWSDDHVHAVYRTTDYDFDASGQLAYHAWESVARKHLQALDPSTIDSIDTSFTRMAKRFREPGEERRWRLAGRPDGAGDKTVLSKGSDESETDKVSHRLIMSPDR